MQALQSSPPSGPDQAIELFGLAPERLQLLKNTIARGTTDDEFQLFVHVCKTRRIDPFSKLIYPVKRYDSKLQQEVMALQSSIDYFRLAAERTGMYAGQLGPQWCGDDGDWKDVWLAKTQPRAARVGVLRKDFQEPLWAVALWDGYAQTYFNRKSQSDELAPFWKRMGPLMLAKCAEALALRRAFPEDLAGLYVGEEMDQADSSGGNGKAAPQLGPSAQESAEFRAALDKPKTIDALAKSLPVAEAEQARRRAGDFRDPTPEEAAAKTAERVAAGLPAQPFCDTPESRQLRAEGEAALAKAEAEKKKPKKAEPEPIATVAHEVLASVTPPPSEIQVYTWSPTDDAVLEVAIPVNCGLWAKWADEEVPVKGAFYSAVSRKGPPTWRTAAAGKKGGGRHALLMDIVNKAQKIHPQERHAAHLKAACALAMLLASKTSDPSKEQEPGVLPGFS